ncbi:hypothetical protein SEA_YABOI_256 [Streptomyces phage Yaboi]|uniref:Uncharacterized protein n=2 Tax=Streptomyces virus Yaboi TaxID=2846408 RepID=A0A385UHM5_9CAUD|nr:hypothetical protein HWB86_gp071 [Streptomyces phage Yaboi]AYB71048.1 hypothetical protein SEA_YABOI_256 [Streptomyces phage Yaboi]QAY08871.1 hypothetical protein SEA_GENIE2_250 [Streptomyces phage Genie2]WNM73798.1 hypothetical protein SEA_SOLLERTIA_252 [Streptomyces phage Sollertia]
MLTLDRIEFNGVSHTGFANSVETFLMAVTPSGKRALDVVIPDKLPKMNNRRWLTKGKDVKPSALFDEARNLMIKHGKARGIAVDAKGQICVGFALWMAATGKKANNASVVRMLQYAAVESARLGYEGRAAYVQLNDNSRTTFADVLRYLEAARDRARVRGE